MNVQIRADFNRVQNKISKGFAKGLTAIAKAGQEESIRDINATFTVRGQWFQPSNRFGIKVKTAKAENLKAEVTTLASWLVLHETGGTKQPSGANLTIPTPDVKRNKRDIVQKSQRPRNLGGKAFKINLPTGKALVQKIKRGAQKGRLRFLYWMEPTAQIRKQSTFFEPITQTFTRRGQRLVVDSIRAALQSGPT